MSSVCVLKLKVQFCTQRKMFEECAQDLTFHVGGANASLWLRLCWTPALQNVGGSEWVRSQKRLGAWRRKDWHGLHESSYCYFKVYMGTRNLKRVISTACDRDQLAYCSHSKGHNFAQGNPIEKIKVPF